MRLKRGDTIAFVAPASKFNPEILPLCEQKVAAWGLKAKICCPFSDEEWLCTHSEEVRAKILEECLHDPAIGALWVVLGGYGCSPLLPLLDRIERPPTPKLLLGFSDTTILHLFFHNKWNWETLHTISGRQLALGNVSEQSVSLLKDALFEEEAQLQVTPLNNNPLPACPVTITGGNLSLITCSLGTPWQIDVKGKYLLLEEIGERAYRIDRMLHHLEQAGIIRQAAGILLGSMIQKESLTTDQQTQKILQRWISKIKLPLFSCEVGHGKENHPVPLNCPRVFLKKRVF